MSKIPWRPCISARPRLLYFGVETPVRSVEVYQEYAITENAFGYVHSLDVSDLTNPVQAAFNNVMGNPSNEIHVSQSDGQVHATGAQYFARLGIEEDGGLTTTGLRDFDFGSGAVFGTETIAYVGYAGAVYILDLLLPGFPPSAIIDTGGVTDLVVRDGYAYVINSDRFQVLDVSIPNNPAHVSNLPLDTSLRDIVVSDGYAYLASRIDGLKVIDISDPENPFEAGTYTDVFAITWQTKVAGSHAYLAHSANGLTILDISDLSRPEHLASTGSLTETRDVAYQAGLVYTADGTGGLRIFDVAGPSQPLEIGTIGGFNGWRLLVDGDLVYLIDAVPNDYYFLRIFDVSDPTMPVELFAMRFQENEVMSDLTKYDDYLYVAGDNAGVRIIDVADPLLPMEVGSYDLPDVTDLGVEGGTALRGGIRCVRRGPLPSQPGGPREPAVRWQLRGDGHERVPPRCDG
ncbi:MAG: hypothetical protein GF330_07850 [Candidatus Eisenbacteria bacterium]|nr:hypothetical protein [Candidatus Eisenbacteria bacterium]